MRSKKKSVRGLVSVERKEGGVGVRGKKKKKKKKREEETLTWLRKKRGERKNRKFFIMRNGDRNVVK